jgi:hypothetical protein
VKWWTAILLVYDLIDIHIGTAHLCNRPYHLVFRVHTVDMNSAKYSVNPCKPADRPPLKSVCPLDQERKRTSTGKTLSRHQEPLPSPKDTLPGMGEESYAGRHALRLGQSVPGTGKVAPVARAIGQEWPQRGVIVTPSK